MSQVVANQAAIRRGLYGVVPLSTWLAAWWLAPRLRDGSPRGLLPALLKFYLEKVVIIFIILPDSRWPPDGHVSRKFHPVA